METLLAVSGLLVVLALIFVARMFAQLRRRRVLRAGGSAVGGATSAAFGGAGMMLVISIYGYEQLTDETVVSLIEFRQTAPGEYSARLMIEGELDRTFALKGDEWQMDARVITWQPPATILGMEPIYRLERLSGRYTDIDEEQTAPRTVHALSEDSALDIWNVARRFPALMPGVDAYYGTATFVPMADGARYEVSLSRDALIARPVNDRAREAVGEWQHNAT